MLFEEFKMTAMGHGDFLDGCHGGFSHKESSCRSDASHQVSAKFEFPFGTLCRFKYFKMAAMAAILDVRSKRF